jgi:hypothetical protein
MTCKRFALRKWRGMREGCTVVPAMRSTALLRLPVCLHPPPQQQHKNTLNLAVKQNLVDKKKKFIPTQNIENRNERERERENLVGEKNWFELTRFMLKSRFIQIGKQSLHDDGAIVLLLQ